MTLRTGCILVTDSYVNFSPGHRPTIVGNQLERVLGENYSDGFAILAGENRPTHVKPVMLFRHRWQISPNTLGRAGFLWSRGQFWIMTSVWQRAWTCLLFSFVYLLA